MDEPRFYIGFTGHRDVTVDPALIEAIHAEFPGAVWCHGGAKGFDKQIERYALKHDVSDRRYLPQYDLYPPKQAPIMRNFQIVDASAILVAAWDGRTSGGTYRTIQYAKEQNKPIRYWSPVASF